MMNIGYLEALPEVANVFNEKLEDGEKAVFTTKLSIMGTDKDSMIGQNCDFTLTNKRIIVDNGAGVWFVDLVEDVDSCSKVESSRWIFKSTYFSLTLKEELIFDNGKQRLKGFHYYFKKEDVAKFEQIVNNLF